MQDTIPRLMTTKQLAEILGVKLHRLEYATRTRNIEAQVRVEKMRLWHRSQLPDIQAALDETAQPRPSVRNQGWDVLVEELVEGEQDAA